MIVRTCSGSRYEVDIDNQQIRRLSGKNDPTARVGKDSEWRSYQDLIPMTPEIGLSMIIVWSAEDTSLLPETQKMLDNGELGFALPMTQTSPIEAIES